MSALSKPCVICLTPVRNEAWILQRFLACAGLWADHILIADQRSDDGSRAIACAHPKVTLIDNPSPAYDEAARQRLLLAAARRIPGRRLLFAFDADEVLSADWMTSPEWQRALQAPVGTVIRFQWVNVRPDLQSSWIPPVSLPLGFVDDGSEHHGTPLHSTRIPLPPAAPCLDLDEVKLLHYQYTDWARMKSKQRWYQCWETLHNPRFSPLQGHRLYHQMEAIQPEQVQPLRDEWLAGYQQRGIDMTSVCREGDYWWDREVLKFVREHGTGKFRKLDLWDASWPARVSAGEQALIRDPRGPWEKSVHRWLRRTQGAPRSLRIRLVEKALRLAGW